MHISIHGKWDTTLIRKDEATENAAKQPHQTEQLHQPHETAQLHQFLTKVWGQTKSKSYPKIVYKLSGRIIGEKLALVYREIRGFDSGAILLTIKSKRLMEGYEVGCKITEGSDVECATAPAGPRRGPAASAPRGDKPETGVMYTYPYIWRKREDD